ncbi:MAG: hypothetical protein V3V31_00650 [Methylococcales bacterium]
MIGRSGQNGLFRSRFSILGQLPRSFTLFNFKSRYGKHSSLCNRF